MAAEVTADVADFADGCLGVALAQEMPGVVAQAVGQV